MIAPAKTVYLHIGTQKTGSSALQFFFTDNLKRLASQYDVLYPDPLHSRFGMGIKKFHNHAKLAMSLIGYWGVPLEKQYPAEELWGDVQKLINTASQSRILLSSELFGIRQMASHYKTIRKFLNDCDIKIVIYLRRQDNFLTSVYNEQVKAGRTTAIDEFISEFEGEAEYDQLLRDLSNTFGKENIVVRPYEKQQFYKNNILADFLHHIFGIEFNDEFAEVKQDPNPRLIRDALEFMRIANSLSKDSLNLRRFLTVYSRKYPEEVVLLSPEQRQKIMNKYAAGNEWVVRTFLGRENGRLFLEPFPNPNDPWQPYPGLNLEKTLNFSKQLLRDKHPDFGEEELNEKLTSLMVKAVAEEFINLNDDEQKNRRELTPNQSREELQQQLLSITASRSWRLTRPIRWIGQLVRKVYKKTAMEAW